MRDDVIRHSTQTSLERPEWLDDRLRWFQSLELGVILHWGVYALWDCCESWPIAAGEEWARGDGMRCWNERDHDIVRFQKDYWDLIEQFNPVHFDPDAWVAEFVAAGAKYVCFTTKHHDGFCLWDTATTDYKITGERSPYRVDVTRQLFDACRRAGLAVSVYFSKADWHCPDYWANPHETLPDRHANTLHDPEAWERFVQYTHAQIRELLTNYGKIDILWLDAGWVKNEEDIRMAEIVAMGRELQPGLLVANRTVGDFEDFVTPEREIPEEGLDVPWEACLPVCPDWKYTEGQTPKPATEVFEEFQRIRRLGGNFLVGVGPKPDGTLPESSVAVLRELGQLRKA